RGVSTVINTGYNSNALAFDVEVQKVVMWDGTQDVTWEWNNTTHTWASVAAPTPPARGYIASAYDVARKQVVLFGGYIGGSNFNDTWLRGTTWDQPAPFAEPTPRFGGGAT